MISKNLLKDIIVSNEEFILTQVKRIIGREGIILPKDINKTVVFYGVRRSGKTFILFDLFKKHSDSSIYVDFEDERLSGFKLGDFERLKEGILELKPHLIRKELFFFLDEIQNIEGWEKFCRRAVEREKIKVFVSGSSSKMMPMEIHTALRGRVWSIEVLPFSFTEYLYARGIQLKQKADIYGEKKAIIKNFFSEFMKWGGFPEVSFLSSDIERTMLLKEYFGAMFFRDLVERYKMTNISLLESLSDKLFSSFSQKFSATSFYRQYKDKFPFSKDILFKYYKYFLQSMLIYEVRKFAESTYTRMRNPAKIYSVDTGLCRRVTSEDAGRLLENIVFLELRRRGYEVFYFDEKKECDFIAKNGDHKLFPIQVCLELNEENRMREIEGIVEACRWLHIKTGFILTYDEEMDITIEGVRIRILPVWKWVALKEVKSNKFTLP